MFFHSVILFGGFMLSLLLKCLWFLYKGYNIKGTTISAVIKMKKTVF